MEYRNRRMNVRNRKNKAAGHASSILIVIIIIAAGVYLLSITKAGDWIEKNVFNTIVSAFKPDKKKEPENTDSIFTSTDGGSIELPKFECYMIQMGAFSTPENANEMANAVKSRGGGGYVLYDADKYRVLASGYSTEQEARDAKDLLKQRGFDCSVHRLCIDTEEYSVSVVSGTDSTISQLQSVMYALLSAHDDLLSLSNSIDNESITVAQGCAASKNIYDNLKSDIGDTDALPSEVLDCITSYEKKLEALIGGEGVSMLEYSQMVKNAQIGAACEYVQLIKGMM